MLTSKTVFAFQWVWFRPPRIVSEPSFDDSAPRHIFRNWRRGASSWSTGVFSAAPVPCSWSGSLISHALAIHQTSFTRKTTTSGGRKRCACKTKMWGSSMRTNQGSAYSADTTRMTRSPRRDPAGRRRRVCWPWGPARVCRPCPMCGQRCTGHPQNSYDNACTHALEGMNLHEWGS